MGMLQEKKGDIFNTNTSAKGFSLINMGFLEVRKFGK